MTFQSPKSDLNNSLACEVKKPFAFLAFICYFYRRITKKLGGNGTSPCGLICKFKADETLVGLQKMIIDEKDEWMNLLKSVKIHVL